MSWVLAHVVMHHPHTDLPDSDVDALVLTSIICSGLSLAASLAAFFVFWCSPSLRGKFVLKLISYISLSDIFVAVGNLLSIANSHNGVCMCVAPEWCGMHARACMTTDSPRRAGCSPT